MYIIMKNHSIILLIAISCIILQVSAKEFTENHTTELLNGRVVKSNDHLVHVSVREGSIHLTSPDANFVPCQLKIDEDANVKYRLKDAKSLGNGKIIVWNNGYNNGLLQWKVYIIDPANCTIKTVTKVGKDGISLNEINTVIPYQDSFDIFSQAKECAPCRFKDNGEPIDLPNTTYKPLELPNEYIISPIGDNAVSGYLLAQTFKNCTSLLKTLSPTFEVQKEQPIDRFVETISADLGRIRICSTPTCLGNPNVTHDCEVLDSGIRSDKKSLERITEKEDTFLKLVQNLPDGGAVAVYVNQAGCLLGDGEGAFGDIYVRRIHADGRVDPDVKFDTVSCWEYDFDNFYMRDGKYCLVAYDGVNTGIHPQTVFIKCLKYDD